MPPLPDLLDRLIPYQKLADAAWKKCLADAYLSAQPYPHVMIDDFFDEAVLDRTIEEFPSSDALSNKFDNVREFKHATASELEIPPFGRALVHALNSGTFIAFLEEITGIRGLVPDPHLWGGGFHVLPRGGKVKIHTDFNYHRKLGLDRRINVLVYLNRNWSEAYGGHFEAWRPHGTKAEARYLPIFNRVIVFGTTDFTFHGNPESVDCPEGMSRKSIAVYYYTKGRPRHEWSGLVQSTTWMNRPGEAILERPPTLRRLSMRRLLTSIMPKPARIWLTRKVLATREAKE
jgi:Rps23 Pro-64 3,4-dihydroxylase Tpa1-like proline 4-hydroxylase